MMTRKHYEAIAEIAKKNRPEIAGSWWRMVKKLADYFETENSKFDRKKFIKACL